MSVEIVPVTTRKQQKEFVQFAFRHYANDPNWVPPLIGNQKELLNFKPHPFYDNAEIQTFLATQNGQTVGRIAAIIDHSHNEHWNEHRGMFGFFESTDDQEVANALFDAAKKWLGEKGYQQIRGPANPSQNHEWGLLIDAFDKPPTFMMTYNKPFYAKLIENYGFTKAQDMYAFWGHVSMLQELDPKLEFVAKECRRRFDLKLRRVEKATFREDVQTFMDIYNKAVLGQWGFVPMSQTEVKHAAKGLKQLIVPEMTAIAEFEGKPVGIVFGLLDYNQLIKEIGGKLFPFGFLKLLFKRKQVKKIRLISTNVLPEFQRWGLGVVLMNQLVADVLKWGVEEAEFSWVLESNKLSRGTLERGGAKLEKTYRIYDYEPQ